MLQNVHCSLLMYAGLFKKSFKKCTLQYLIVIFDLQNALPPVLWSVFVREWIIVIIWRSKRGLGKPIRTTKYN